VLTSPVIRILKKQVPDAEIHFLSKKNFAAVLEDNPYIDQFHWYDGKISETTKNLKKEHFDYVVDLHNNLRTFLIKEKIPGKKSAFDKLNIKKWLLVNFKVKKMPSVHIVDRYLDAAKKHFDLKNDNQGLDFFINPKNEILPKELVDLIPSKYLVFAIGGQHATKKLPVKKIIEICQKTAAKTVLIGGKEDQKTANEILIKVGKEKIVNVCGLLNIQQSAFLIKNSELVISHDTGMMHIASAFKKNIFSVWGNTVPELGMYPYLAGENSQMFEVPDLRCRPCSKIGFDKCPKKHFYCMELQDTGLIAEQVQKLIS
jgi:ADP-heptose:LPS heptosyltransferase